MQRQLIEFPILGDLIRRVDLDTQKFGIQEALRNLASRTQTQLIVRGKTQEVERVLASERVVAVSNHPCEVDTLVLFASLPKREDVALIISSRFMNIAPNIDRYLIPVYVQHHSNNNWGGSIQGRFLRKFHKVKRFTPDAEHEKNKKSIELASKKVRDGGLVIIFPSPKGIKVGIRWYKGVGYLLKGASSKKPIYVVKAYIKGTSSLDYFRLIPKVGKFLHPLEVTFSKPIEANGLLKNDPKKIASILESEYNQWAMKIGAAS